VTFAAGYDPGLDRGRLAPPRGAGNDGRHCPGARCARARRVGQFGGQFLPADLGLPLRESGHGRPVHPRKPTFCRFRPCPSGASGSGESWFEPRRGNGRRNCAGLFIWGSCFDAARLRIGPRRAIKVVNWRPCFSEGSRPLRVLLSSAFCPPQLRCPLPLASPLPPACRSLSAAGLSAVEFNVFQTQTCPGQWSEARQSVCEGRDAPDPTRLAAAATAQGAAKLGFDAALGKVTSG
jgi:hypothetical protein